MFWPKDRTSWNVFYHPPVRRSVPLYCRQSELFGTRKERAPGESELIWPHLEVCLRAPPQRVRRVLALLTQTYHGSQLAGNWAKIIFFSTRLGVLRDFRIKGEEGCEGGEERGPACHRSPSAEPRTVETVKTCAVLTPSLGQSLDPVMA